jgi:hypothetical protein
LHPSSALIALTIACPRKSPAEAGLGMEGI